MVIGIGIVIVIGIGIGKSGWFSELCQRGSDQCGAGDERSDVNVDNHHLHLHIHQEQRFHVGHGLVNTLLFGASLTGAA